MYVHLYTLCNQHKLNKIGVFKWFTEFPKSLLVTSYTLLVYVSSNMAVLGLCGLHVAVVNLIQI